MAKPPSAPIPSSVQTLLWVRRPTEFMRYCDRKYGKTFRVQLPSFELNLTRDRDAVRTIFAAKPEEMHAGRFNFILRPLVGESSVLLLDGMQHMKRRKLLLPAFHGERMRLYGETMADITRRTIGGWKSGETVPLHRYTQEITLQVILRTVFGADEAHGAGPLSASIKRMLSQIDRPMSFLQLLYLAQHPEKETSQPWRWLLRNRQTTDDLLYAMIAERRTKPAGSTGQDVLSMLLGARDERGEGLSDRDLRNELMTALAAGHETTATSLAWAVERLLNTPAAYARLREELETLGRDPEPEALAELPYLDATIKEVLRLRPVIPLVGRVLMKPYSLAGFDFPEGSVVGACTYLAQRDPEVYPEPDAFRPERFLDVSPDPTSWLPFGGGIRRCIGAPFAMYEMKIVLGTLLSACELELSPPGAVRIVRRAVTLFPKGGTRVRVRSLAA